MPHSIGFDNEKYLREQSHAILERVGETGSKLYLEFGGKLMFDYHAARVLPGYDPNVKMRLLSELSHAADVILCIHAGAIERKKMRADFGITYDADALKLIDDLRAWSIDVAAVVITRYTDQASVKAFRQRLEQAGIPVHMHRPIQGYPANVDLIVSDDGYGANSFVETRHPLVVVTGPGPGSGKMSTCLSQVYHEFQRDRHARYAKFETFPIWNLPLQHPVNIAYEAATADLADFNLIDPFHLEAYDQTAINYNRDVASFPVLKTILERITGDVVYRSPTDMGVNRAGFGIVNDDAVRQAALQEIVRRYFRYRCERAMGLADKDTVDRAEAVMRKASVSPDFRPVVQAAQDAAAAARAAGKGNEGVYCGAALELPDETVIAGKNSPLMHASASVVLNAVKHLAGIPDQMHLLSPSILQSISRFKGRLAGHASGASLDLSETLVALCSSSATNPSAQLALERLQELSHCDMHLTHIPTPGDEAGLRRIGIHLTSDPQFPAKRLQFS